MFKIKGEGCKNKVLFAKKQAFSVAELSVVVVASGLLLFAGFKGFDLVKKAKVNSLVKQISEIKTAVDVFQDANGALPGDISSSSIADFSNMNDSTKSIDIVTGFASTRGNNDGSIFWGNQAACANASANGNLINESSSAWYQLFYGNYMSDVGIVSNNKASYSLSGNFAAESLLPSTKIKGLNVAFFAHSLGDVDTNDSLIQPSTLSYKGNNIIITGIKTPASVVACKPQAMPFASVITTVEAKMMDSMIDDGVQNTGNLLRCSTILNETDGTFTCASGEGSGFSTISIKLIQKS